jgi:hypothetical protein
MGEKGLSSANEAASVSPVAVPAGIEHDATAAAVDALPESISGRFEEAARKAQERIRQRSQAQPQRTSAGDDGQ